MKKITVNVMTGEGIDEALREIRARKQRINRKVKELCERCAVLGATVASLRFARTPYTGNRDVSVSVEETANGYVVKAEGETALVLEFGSGIRYGGGHPENGQYGMGPGTYPDGKGHWDDPKGWWIPKEAGGGHTYGNPPAMAMYEARKEIEQRLAELAREVFSG